MTDPCLFPGAKKNWKAFVAELVDKKHATTKHHEEVDPKTLQDLPISHGGQGCYRVSWIK